LSTFSPWENVNLANWLLLEFSLKLLKENNRPIGENSHNLVTLKESKLSVGDGSRKTGLSSNGADEFPRKMQKAKKNRKTQHPFAEYLLLNLIVNKF
jgi:hypothetical protein